MILGGWERYKVTSVVISRDRVPAVCIVARRIRAYRDAPRASTVPAGGHA